MKLSEYRSTDSNMIMADVQMMMNNLLIEHGLMDQGWMFNFDRAKKRFGLCDYTHKTIFMSKYLTPGRTFAENYNTATHEIAHALVGHGHGHDAVWKAKAIEIGSSGERCSSMENVAAKPEFRWFGVCDTCEYRVGLHRAPNIVRSCPNCSPFGADFNFRLSWHEFGVEKNVEEMPNRFQSEFWKLWNFYVPKTATLAMELETVSYSVPEMDDADNSDGDE